METSDINYENIVNLFIKEILNKGSFNINLITLAKYFDKMKNEKIDYLFNLLYYFLDLKLYSYFNEVLDILDKMDINDIINILIYSVKNVETLLMKFISIYTNEKVNEKEYLKSFKNLLGPSK